MNWSIHQVLLFGKELTFKQGEQRTQVLQRKGVSVERTELGVRQPATFLACRRKKEKQKQNYEIAIKYLE